ncbi:MAG: hypothetical protein M1821_001906 [Bathelium mastoideum]|nr:MAG: hypothetical protein M1821_001906 [Bathelium mastoideum]
MKRIIICFDGTFTDTGDTPERTKPGSTVSRLARWVLPPLVWQLLWILRVFVPFKWIEHGFWPPGPQEIEVTNVSLLASAIKPCAPQEGGGDVQQMTLYIGGIGALGTPQSRLEEAVTGNTMTYKVRNAYRFLIDNYCPGDEIFLFGFSRGAFAARTTADFIDVCGISKKSAIDYFDTAWAKFADARKSGTRKERDHHQTQDSDTSPIHPRASIQCIGVWDTVGSLGAPPLFFVHRNDVSTARAAHRRRDRFNLSVRPNANYAFQALALDERRFDFYPAVWSPSAPEQARTSRFCQTWFPGVHTDVGGGKRDGLSQYAFIWMISKIQEDKLLDLDDEFIDEEVLQPIRRRRVPPWQLSIVGRDYVEKIMPKLGFLPQWIKDLVRTAHRNPYMAAASVDPDVNGAADSVIEAEQKFHWTVVQRIKHLDGAYWASCLALKKGTQEEVLQREEIPEGKDRALKTYVDSLCSNASGTRAL